MDSSISKLINNRNIIHQSNKLRFNTLSNKLTLAEARRLVKLDILVYSVISSPITDANLP